MSKLFRAGLAATVLLGLPGLAHAADFDTSLDPSPPGTFFELASVERLTLVFIMDQPEAAYSPSVVPEPASVLVLAAGMLGLGLSRARRGAG